MLSLMSFPFIVHFAGPEALTRIRP